MALPGRGVNVLCPRCHAVFADGRERCTADGWKLVADRRGQTIAAGRFRIEGLLGVGGGGSSVWSAHERGRADLVALKLMPSQDPQERARFERGAILARSLDHPQIARVFDHASDGDTLWVSMELLSGTTLAGRLVGSHTLAPLPAVELVDQVLAALEVAHAAEIVHRDIKPANLFVTATDARVLILDFGIARLSGPSAAERFGPFFPDDDPIAPALESEVTGQHRICGTPEYMAPEQILGGEPDPRSDLYALGVILYRMLSGQLPFRARTRYEMYHRHLHQAPPPLLPALGVPAPLSAAVMRALAKRPEDRFRDAAEMREVLRAAVGLEPVPRPRLFPSEVEGSETAAAPDMRPLGVPLIEAGGVPPTPSILRARLTGRDVPRSPAPTSRRSRVLVSAFGLAVAVVAGLVVL